MLVLVSIECWQDAFVILIATINGEGAFNGNSFHINQTVLHRVSLVMRLTFFSVEYRSFLIEEGIDNRGAWRVQRKLLGSCLVVLLDLNKSISHVFSSPVLHETFEGFAATKEHEHGYFFLKYGIVLGCLLGTEFDQEEADCASDSRIWGVGY